jgi:predicted enzyme related to lactoylglutathione lyase
MPSSPSKSRFECVVPILRVSDLRKSLGYYLNALGFKKDWDVEGGAMPMASVSRDGFSVMFCQGGQGHVGAWVWFGVEDVEPLHAEFVASGAKVVLPPTNFSWALEMRVEDPDGNVLRFGSESKAGEALQDSKA